MDFINCPIKSSSKNCYDCKIITDSVYGSCDHIYATLVECKTKGINVDNFVNVEPVTISTNKCDEDPVKMPASWLINSNILKHQPFSVLARRMNSSENEVDEGKRKITRSPYRLMRDANFLCPRCDQRMEEPRLLPCLHPICLSCVYELINRLPFEASGSKVWNDNRTYATSSVGDICPLCGSHLPNVNCAVPPPHYPLQNRLVMDTVRRKLVNRVLCDACTAHVLALVQCSTCLRNFCLECGRRHEQQNIAETKTTKHLMRPLWEATKVRRTILCQIHPTHTLKFYCIACQQVTCKECMWSLQHRGHANEDAVGVGKRVGAYLTTISQRAKAILNNLLIQYDYDVFLNNTSEESQNTEKLCRYV